MAVDWRDDINICVGPKDFSSTFNNGSIFRNKLHLANYKCSVWLHYEILIYFPTPNHPLLHEKRIYRVPFALMELPCYRTTQAKSERLRICHHCASKKINQIKLLRVGSAEKKLKNTNQTLIEHLFQQYSCEVKELYGINRKNIYEWLTLSEVQSNCKKYLKIILTLKCNQRQSKGMSLCSKY
jgi:hypothetical protein